MMLQLALPLLLAVGAIASAPNIVFLLVDDLGFNGVGYHNPELNTPTIDALAKEGTLIDSFYTYKVCAPARASFLTGRYPFHMRAVKTNFAYFQTLEGTNLNYTMFPELLQTKGYETAMVGKWHQGFYAPQFLPTSRGFDSYFGFLSGCEDHDNQQNCCAPCDEATYGIGKPVDLFDSGKPALLKNGTNTGFLFTSAATEVIANHAVKSGSKPLFLYLAMHNTHAPFEVPTRFSDHYNYSQELRNTWSGMVEMVDETVKNVTGALKNAGMWENTLFVMAGDNGSPTCGWGAAGSNAPLRGGKSSNWEGGVRTFAFASGGVVPEEMRGKSLDGLVHISDFYRTFLSLAGLPDATDPGGPTPLDSVDVSSYLLGAADASPREEIIHDHYNTNAGCIRSGDYKLIVGAQNQATWFGQFSPNASFVPSGPGTTACQDRPCLFNIKEDPTEHNDLADDPKYNATATMLLTRFRSFDKAYHPPSAPGSDEEGYCSAAAKAGGFMVPWRTEVVPYAATADEEVDDITRAIRQGSADPSENPVQWSTFVSGGLLPPKEEL